MNQAHVFLLPKKDCDASPNSYRPISLQNFRMKGVAKVFTNRLKPLIPYIVHDDQTRFISGRNTVGNFVYALDIARVYHTRKKPTMMLQLDFRKSFNSDS